MIKIFSSYAKDLIFNKSNKLIAIRKGGPAFFIERIFKKSRLKYRLFKSFSDAEIEIKLCKKREVGRIIERPAYKKITKLSDGVAIVSTVSAEWMLGNKISKKAKIFLDIQGYARAAKKDKSIFNFSFWGKVFCLKGNAKEVNELPRNIIQKQKKKILIITKGEQGVEVYFKNKKYIIKTNKIKTQNTVGAGDTFFASFVVEFVKTENAVESGKFAVRETERFLRKKQYLKINGQKS